MILNFNKRLFTALVFGITLFFLFVEYTFFSSDVITRGEKLGTTGGYDYDNADNDGGSDWCSRVAGRRYIDDFASTWTISCDGSDERRDVRGGMVCFQSQIEEEPDNFCVARNAVYSSTPIPVSKEDLFPEHGILPLGADGGEKVNTRPSRPYKRDTELPRVQPRQSLPWNPWASQWSLDCSSKKEWAYGVQPPFKFRSYFSETGVGPQLRWFDMKQRKKQQHDQDLERTDGAVQVNGEGTVAKECKESIMLVKLEGGGNIWHTLMEVWSAVLTLDILKRAAEAKEHLFGSTGKEGGVWEEDSITIYIQENMQSEMDASPVFGLWDVVTGKDVKDVKELKDGCYKSVILPLAGGANPFWKDHWKERNCERSSLVDGFVGKVMKFYGVEDAPAAVKGADAEEQERVKIRIIGRQHNRKILRLFDYIKTLQTTYPDADIEITKLERLDVTEQLRMMRKTDILIGVTGAGLTHTMFLRKGAAVVELTQPEPFTYFGFGNIAKMRGIEYFAVHGQKREGKSSINWQEDNVLVDERALVEVVGKAIEGQKRRKGIGS
ncbi:hypothetical protein TWF481_009319 [Arthrobotrys musiformis]|uniref:EGF domain-specific O-linked N-acetylglucosamine transferase n=1 Tax=Arthrobotrys musiformis TaxID=47236 RepID=A0AAV9W933_9PEZI